MPALGKRSLLLLITKKLHIQSKSSATYQASTEQTGSKSYNDIPTKRGVLPAALDLLRSGGPGYLHEHCDRRHAELGPIYRERLGSTELVFIADTKMIQTVIANEGSQPHHNVPEAWLLYNKVKNIERGLFFQVGEPWLKLRRALNKVMLADPSKTTRFASDILAINSDLFDVWRRKLGPTSDNRDMASHDNDDDDAERDFVVRDIKFELCKWSIEATGLMLFGCRMGCIPSDGRELSSTRRADRLVKSVASMFAETSNFQLLPCRLAQLLNLAPWARFEAASDNMLDLANRYAAEFIARAKISEDGSESMVKDLLGLKALDEDQISRSMVDLIIAAADTTSNSLQWMLYILAKYARVQATIRREVEALGGDLSAFQNIKQSCPYLCAFVREVSRLYPTAPFLARTLERVISLDGYTLPAGVPIVFSLYTTSRMSAYFENPLEFKPERWLRSEQQKALQEPQTKAKTTSGQAFASLPFGVGARMCIGRRMAELEMHLLIASFVSRFAVSLADQDDQDIRIKLNMILCPDKPIRLRLKPLGKQDKARDLL